MESESVSLSLLLVVIKITSYTMFNPRYILPRLSRRAILGSARGRTRGLERHTGIVKTARWLSSLTRSISQGPDEVGILNPFRHGPRQLTTAIATITTPNDTGTLCFHSIELRRLQCRHHTIPYYRAREPLVIHRPGSGGNYIDL